MRTSKSFSMNINVNMEHIANIISRKMRQTLGTVGIAMLYDFDNVEPKCPVDTGKLINSSIVEMGEDNKVYVGYLAGHAIFPHENFRAVNWTRPGSGPGYVFQKIVNPVLQERYARIVVESIEAELRKVRAR